MWTHVRNAIKVSTGSLWNLLGFQRSLPRPIWILFISVSFLNGSLLLGRMSSLIDLFSSCYRPCNVLNSRTNSISFFLHGHKWQIMDEHWARSFFWSVRLAKPVVCFLDSSDCCSCSDLESLCSYHWTSNVLVFWSLNQMYGRPANRTCKKPATRLQAQRASTVLHHSKWPPSFLAPTAAFYLSVTFCLLFVVSLFVCVYVCLFVGWSVGCCSSKRKRGKHQKTCHPRERRELRMPAIKR